MLIKTTSGEAKETRIDVSEFDRMYKCNIQAHIDYELSISKLTPDEKKRNTTVNPGKKYANFADFINTTMTEYSEVNYGDVVLTENGKEIKRIPSNFKHISNFKNPESTKSTQGSFPKSNNKKQ